MILTDREIRIAIDRGQVAIAPVPAPDRYSSTSIDLLLDESIRIFTDGLGSGIQIDPGARDFDFHQIANAILRDIKISPQWSLPPKQLVLGWTREFVELPIASRLAARVEGRSSLARLGVAIHITAPTIHAGFKGKIQLEIINHGPAPVVLRPGMKICQLIFETTLGTPEKGYSGTFLGQTPQKPKRRPTKK